MCQLWPLLPRSFVLKLKNSAFVFKLRSFLFSFLAKRDLFYPFSKATFLSKNSVFSKRLEHDPVLATIFADVHPVIGKVDPFLQFDALDVFRRPDGDGDVHLGLLEIKGFFFDSLTEGF